MARRPRTRRSPADPLARIVTSAFELAAVHGWRGLTLERIARAIGIELAEVQAQVASKRALLAAMMRAVDERVAAAVGGGEAEESTRDRLFEVVMARFDALKPYKEAVRRIAADLLRDPLSGAYAGTAMRRSLEGMLALAKADAPGLRGLVRVKGLGLIYANALRVWLRDESADAAKTMAALDRSLSQAEAAVLGCQRLCRGRVTRARAENESAETARV